MRGEHADKVDQQVVEMGSSPHARGALLPALPGYGLLGIIPACAGSTTPATSATQSARDHPRMRGEHRAGYFAHSRVEGSSPQARGALTLEDVQRGTRGIIPACAGSTTRA